jgi:acetolactate synthase-1/2/3 large subunit
LARVADYIANYLVDLGVTDIFMVSGGGIMHLLDGVKCNKNINYICTHNEAAAAIMSEGYSRVLGNIGVVFVTTGPGATNAVTGTVDAWIDSIPLLVISGQTRRSQNVYNSGIDGLRQLGGQEVNILPIVQSFTKYSAMINEPGKIKYHLDKAIYYAKNGRPGPSWLDIPLDVQAAEIDEDNLESFVSNNKSNQDTLVETQIVDAFKHLKQAERPVIIVGNGVRLSGAGKEFLKLIDKIKIPVVVSKLGEDLIDYNHPYFVGFGGTRGTRAANFALQNSDLILSLGSRLANPFIGYEPNLFARAAKKIVVDIDPCELEKFRSKLYIGINCNVKLFIEKMLNFLQQEPLSENSEWIEKCRHWKKKYQVINEPHFIEKKWVSIYSFFDRLSHALNNNSIVIGDSGSVYYVISQAMQVKYGQRILVPAGLGSMGLSLPLGIGAYYASKDSTIVAVTGDGSLQMNIQELQTVVHYKIPLKLFVINNEGYLSIKRTQEKSFEGRLIGSCPDSGVSFPNLRKIAYAYGIEYNSIKGQDQLEKKIEDTINYKGPIICEIFTDPNEKIMPSVTSKILPNGQMVSMPLEDMFPFLPREEFEQEMIVKAVDYNKGDNTDV